MRSQNCERAQCGGVWVSIRVLTSERTHQEACCMCQDLDITTASQKNRQRANLNPALVFFLHDFYLLYSAEFWPNSLESPAKMRKLVDISGQEGSSLCACTALSPPLWDPLISKWFAYFVLAWIWHLCGWVPAWQFCPPRLAKLLV